MTRRIEVNNVDPAQALELLEEFSLSREEINRAGFALGEGPIGDVAQRAVGNDVEAGWITVFAEEGRCFTRRHGVIVEVEDSYLVDICRETDEHEVVN